MTEQRSADTKNRPVTKAWITVSVCMGVMFFSLAFLRAPIHSGASVLAQPTWIDRYVELMTHPITMIAEIILVCAAFAKGLRGWSLLLFAGFLGMFLGELTHKLLTR